MLAVLAAGLLAGGCAQDEPPAASGGQSKSGGKQSSGARGSRGGAAQPVEVTNLLRRDLSELLNVVGSLAPNETASIRPEMTGLIRAIHFEEGGRVKKGDLLIQIEDSELRAQLAQTEARHELAKLNLDRAENLRRTKSNTQADLDRANSEFAAAQAELALLRVRLQRTALKAPFDGIASSRAVSVGDFVNSSTTITTITDLSRLKVEFQVPERYLSKVKPGTTFVVKSSAVETDAPVRGEVYFVDSVADRATRSTEVKGYLNEPPPGLRAGMFALIELVLEVRKDALTVPEGAIMADQSGPQIITVREQGGDKVAAFVPVKLGLRSRGLVEIFAVRGTLSEADVVVAAGVGSLALFPGGKLQPRPLREEFQIQE